MSKKIIVISTSFRKCSNSDTLADEFIRGAKESGNNVEKIYLEGKTIGFCRGCLVCQKTQECVIKDDAVNIAEKVKKADAIVFATPIYYYEMSGQMKTLLDRLNPLFPSDYTFREVYMIATAADNNSKAMNVAVKGLQGWIACFDKAKLSGVIRGVGVTDIGDIQHNEKLLREVYRMGKAI
ncbi:flavodoxin family protein [Wukongibacter sp. M2B1]|uniref:flavodoxin family protein n=1 Tax=Wukongibacter sp. M2B1 TaxID=3088895 RepID=UPI003D7C0A11